MSDRIYIGDLLLRTIIGMNEEERRHILLSLRLGVGYPIHPGSLAIATIPELLEEDDQK